MSATSPAHFRCPSCGAALRLRERRFVGTTFPCPDCGTGLWLTELSDGSATIQLAAAAGAPTASAQANTVPPQRSQRAPAAKPPRSPSPTSQKLRAWADGLRSPLVISWIAAFVAGTALILVAVLTGPSGVVRQPATEVEVPADLDAPTEPDAATDTDTGWTAAESDTSEARLQKLGRHLQEFTDEQAAFPYGAWPVNNTVPARRWSWLAQLELQRLQQVPTIRAPNEMTAWDSPANEPFVRRQVREYINPAISSRTGELGYPATHFVGVGGVGADAPELPANHPRAGVFAWNRQTRLSDIQDGLSNTMAVTGAETQLGSWAEGGTATVRPLTAEPYLRGPDGLGTGSATELLALMADGSVRALSAQTDPRLLRRMAAMADGLPLDAAVPGEPGTQPPPTSPPPTVQPVAQNPPDEPPVSAVEELTKPAPVVVANLRPDPERVLAQRLTRFQQSKPVPRRELFYLMEDLLGRPVVWTEAELGPARAALDVPVTLELEQATVAEIFDEILRGSGLKYVVQADTIQLLPVRNP